MQAAAILKSKPKRHPTISPTLGVAKDTVLARYHAASYDHDMTRYLESLDPGLVARMEQRVQTAVRSVLTRQGFCRMLVPTIGSGRILDTLNMFRGRDIELHGFDFNPNMMNTAADRLNHSWLVPNASLLDLDLMACIDALPAAYYDVIVWEYSGCVMTSPVNAWKIMAELLRSDGLLIYNDYIGVKSGTVRRSQEELRDAARTAGMRWFYASELAERGVHHTRDIIWTNGIASGIGLDPSSGGHAIVWDPTYAFSHITGQSWFSRKFDVVDMELDVRDVMQTNVSCALQRRAA
jgi:SAM-dependent methyltransferase